MRVCVGGVGGCSISLEDTPALARHVLYWPLRGFGYDTHLPAQVTRLKHHQPPFLRSCDNALFRDPGMGQNILGIQFLKGSLFEDALCEAEDLQNPIASYTDLSVVKGAKGDLEENVQDYNKSGLNNKISFRANREVILETVKKCIENNWSPPYFKDEGIGKYTLYLFLNCP